MSSRKEGKWYTVVYGIEKSWIGLDRITNRIMEQIKGDIMSHITGRMMGCMIGRITDQKKF